jgi:hypothetical protein
MALHMTKSFYADAFKMLVGWSAMYIEKQGEYVEQ